jgi:hypothetical protein
MNEDQRFTTVYVISAHQINKKKKEGEFESSMHIPVCGKMYLIHLYLIEVKKNYE